MQMHVRKFVFLSCHIHKSMYSVLPPSPLITLPFRSNNDDLVKVCSGSEIVHIRYRTDFCEVIIVFESFIIAGL